jgi:hypothetical protein
MENNLPVELLGTLIINNSRVEAIFDDDNLTCKVKIIGTVLPRTCEHCMFWEKPDDYIGSPCSNENVNGLVDDGPEDRVYFRKDFGCIFWEGKE